MHARACLVVLLNCVSRCVCMRVIYVCVHILEACIMHTSFMHTHTCAQKYKFRVLAILFVLISFNNIFRSC